MSVFDVLKTLRYASIESMPAKEIQALTDEKKLRKIIKYGQTDDYPIKATVHAALDAIQDQELLFEAAMTLKDNESRAYAADKLTDQHMLFRVAQNNVKKGLLLTHPRKAAIEKLEDEQLLYALASDQNLEMSLRKEAAKRIHDQGMLYHLSQIPEKGLQSAALENIHDAELIKRMLSEARADEVACALLEKIDDDKLLVYHATTAHSPAVRLHAASLCTSQAAKATCYKEGNTDVRKALLASHVTPEFAKNLQGFDLATEVTRYFDKKVSAEILKHLGLDNDARALQDEIDAARFERVFRHYIEKSPDSSLPYVDTLDTVRYCADEKRVIQLLLEFDRFDDELAHIAVKRFRGNSEVLLHLTLNTKGPSLRSATRDALTDVTSLLRVVQSLSEEYQEEWALDIFDKINDVDCILDFLTSTNTDFLMRVAHRWLGKKVYEACAAGSPSSVFLVKLIDGGADLNYKEILESETYEGYSRARYATALYQAVVHCNQQTVDLLLTSGSIPDEAYYDQTTTYNLASDDVSYAASFNDPGHTRIENLDLQKIASERGIQLSPSA